MTYNEFMSWVEYRRKRGSLNIAGRVDLALAKIELLHLKVNGDKETKLSDLLPYEDFEDKPEQKNDASLDDIFNMLNGLAKRK